MKSIFKNSIAIIGGCILGMVFNMGLIIIGSKLVLPPEGMNPMDAESITSNIHLFKLKHFVFPFLAHAGGTLAGAFATAKVSANHHFILAMGIGVFFLIGGIASTKMIPAPLWFISLDLILAYIPMGWLGWKLSGKN